MNDIDCSTTKGWNAGAGFEPIGEFGGTLEGNNYHISKLYMRNDYTGIISPDSSGVISGLNFRDVELICLSTYCGGFAHNIFGTVQNSSITGTLSCTGKCGGFASQHSGLINESWGGMTIIGDNGMASGFAGHSSNGIVKNSYFRGHLETGNGGGITGLNDGWNGTGMVLNSYSANTFSDDSLIYAGGLIGWQYVGNQSGSYWDKELSRSVVMCGQAGTNCQDDHGLSTEMMKKQSSFIGWDFENIWAIDANKNNGYPYLRWQTSFYQPPAIIEGEEEDDDEEKEEEEKENSDDDREQETITTENERLGNTSTGTRIGVRQQTQLQEQRGLVLGATTDNHHELMLKTYQLKLITHLLQLIDLLQAEMDAK